MSIHPTAIVDPNAKIGRDVEIGPYSVIGPEVTVGDRCRLHQHVTIDGYTTLGEGCEVYPRAALGLAPQDVKYHGERTLLEIGSNNIFREMVTVHPGTANGAGITRIGDKNLFLIGCHVAHDCDIGSHCIIANYVQFAGHVRVEDHVNMGGLSAVHHFVTVGTHAFIGGMTRIAADVPPYMIVVAARGTRSEVRMVNGVGLQRSGYSQSDIAALKDAFMHIFSRRARISGEPIRDRVEKVLKTSDENPHVEYLCRFLMRSFAHGRHGRYLESLRNDPVRRDEWQYKQTFELKIKVVGGGKVRQAPHEVAPGEPQRLELQATADSGWAFAGWNGYLAGAVNPQMIVLDVDKDVTAVFTQVSPP